MPEIKCRHFNGYKPCGLNDICDSACPKRSLVKERILVVHLEALGAVLRSTALVGAIKRKYPDSHVTWVTKKPADALLANVPAVDRVLTTTEMDLLKLSALEFDIGLCVDKSLAAGGVLAKTKVHKLFGFRVEAWTGVILPATPAADELWQIGLSDQKKFFENKKPETQLVCEALELPYRRDPYEVVLSAAERDVAEMRRREWAPQGEVIIGLNTGCAEVIPYKKLTIEMHQKVIEKLVAEFKNKIRIVLLGGPEDTERNALIAQGMPVISSPTQLGLRDGLCSMAAVDVVLTGDSLGMHMAIAMKKWTVAWFGPTCAHEVDLYDRGAHILTTAQCSPCWKRSCQKQPMCYDLVEIDSILGAIRKGIQWYSSSFKQPSSATYSSVARS